MAKVHFNKSVEAAINDCLLQPLKKFMQERKLDRIDISFPAPKGRIYLSPPQLGRLSVMDWADIFEYMTSPQLFKNIQQISSKEMKDFMNNLFGGPHWPDIKPFINSPHVQVLWRMNNSHSESFVFCHSEQSEESGVERLQIASSPDPSSASGGLRVTEKLAHGVNSLKEVNKYRGGSAHYQEAISRYEKEEWELEEMRKIILGIEQPSIIKQIYQLFKA